MGHWPHVKGLKLDLFSSKEHLPRKPNMGAGAEER